VHHDDISVALGNFVQFKDRASIPTHIGNFGVLIVVVNVRPSPKYDAMIEVYRDQA
jgi:hypothetical protein